MNTYTDPKLLDVAGAMEQLPSLPLNAELISTSQIQTATGTYDLRRNPDAPLDAPTSVKTCKSGSFPVASTDPRGMGTSTPHIDATSTTGKRKDSPTTGVNESGEWAMRDSNPRHPRCKHGALTS